MILIWGDMIEDYLDPLEISITDFCDRASGGWMFAFAEALRRAHVKPIIVVWSRTVRRPSSRVHVPTGTSIWLLPPSRLYRMARRWLADPYSWSSWEAIGRRRDLWTIVAIAARIVAPFLTTTPMKLTRLLRRERCRAILCQEYEEGRFDVCVGLGRILRLPVVATFQGGDHTRTRLERLIRPRSARAAAGFIIGAEREAERVRAHYRVSPDRIAKIPNPFDPATIVPITRHAARTELGLCPERTVVVWLGRVDISPKGIDTLIEAWLQVRATSVGSPILLLLGTGSGAAWLRSRIAELELDDICWRDEFVLDRAVVSTYLAAGDLYVLPSRQEGFPVAPMEAMAAGLPVVACDAPGVRAVIGEGSEAGGIIVPTGDAVALAGALRVLIEDGNLRTSLGDTAIRRVADRFSIDAVGVRLRAVLLGT
jgi:starch synthase